MRRAMPDWRVPAWGLLLPAVAVLLCGCASESTLPVDSDAAILSAAAAAIAGCTAPLNADGDIDEAGLLRAGWRPVNRVLSLVVEENNSVGLRDRVVPASEPQLLADGRAYERSEWQRSGVSATLHLSRNGGPIADRVKAQCDISLRSADDAAGPVGAMMRRQLGAPGTTGTRSSGGDWLTPRWFEPDIHERGWQRPQHQISWVSSGEEFVAIEIIAAPEENLAPPVATPPAPAPASSSAPDN